MAQSDFPETARAGSGVSRAPVSAGADARATSGSETALAPIIVSWNLTRLCNLACGHCYLDAVQRRREAPDELTAEEAGEAISQIAALAPGAMLVLTGGEPLLRRDLAALVRRAAGFGLMPVIGTNGTLLDHRRTEDLAAAGAAGVGISLDSATPNFHDRLRGAPGAWGRALRGACAARAAGLRLLIQTTVFDANRADLPFLASLAVEHGAEALNIFFLVCTGRGVTQTDLSAAAYEEVLAAIGELERQHPRLRIRARCAPYARRLRGLHAGEGRQGYADWSSACLAGRRYFRVTPAGEVTPCPYLPVVAGSLRERPLREIWEDGAVFRQLRGELPGGKCGICDFRYSCGGCRARAYAHAGNVLAVDPKCLYIPPAEAEPEIRDRVEANGIVWSAAGLERLDCIPAFLREMVRRRLEEHARNERIRVITAAFMEAHRPEHLGPRRP